MRFIDAYVANRYQTEDQDVQELDQEDIEAVQEWLEALIEERCDFFGLVPKPARTMPPIPVVCQRELNILAENLDDFTLEGLVRRIDDSNESPPVEIRTVAGLPSYLITRQGWSDDAMN